MMYVIKEMFRKLFSYVLIDLEDLEGDYRVFNLSTDRIQSLLTMTVAGVGIFAMLGLDKLLFGENLDLLWWMLILRGG